jgi:hypothetical protein
MAENVFFQSLLNDLDQAVNFSKIGEINKSRVIARQVAGKAIRAMYEKLQFPVSPSINPYQCLILARDNEELFKPILSDLDALTTRVNPDYSFPEHFDLIASAKNIINFTKNIKG